MVLCLNDHHTDYTALYHGDCVDVLRQMPDESIDMSVFSPPFGDLFIYSNSAADMGNSADLSEFMTHYRFFAEQLLRVLKPGRAALVHCSDWPMRKWKDGDIGLYRFSDRLADLHEDVGFITDQRTTIWKCPLVEATRTKTIRLLQKQMRKDSAISSTGTPDYLFKFRKPGANTVFIPQPEETFPIEQWREWASPVWMDIDQTDVLNSRPPKGAGDEKHVCPLQIGLIERCVLLWSNKGETVLSPFMGIGSEGVTSRKLKRRFIGIELKREYFEQSVANIDPIDRQESLL